MSDWVIWFVQVYSSFCPFFYLFLLCGYQSLRRKCVECWCICSYVAFIFIHTFHYVFWLTFVLAYFSFLYWSWFSVELLYISLNCHSFLVHCLNTCLLPVVVAVLKTDHSFGFLPCQFMTSCPRVQQRGFFPVIIIWFFHQFLLYWIFCTKLRVKGQVYALSSLWISFAGMKRQPMLCWENYWLVKIHTPVIEVSKFRYIWCYTIFTKSWGT